MLKLLQAKRAAKAAERPAVSQSSAKPKVASEEELPPNKYFEYRCKKINELRISKNPDPYPHKFQTSISIPEFVDKYKDLKRGEQLRDIQVALAGRILVIRDNNKLKFYDLHGEVYSHF
jgi:lysyl-tRNA synthetase, class II